MLADLEAALARDALLPPFDFGVVELFDSAALHAHKMIVVLPFVQLEHRFAGFEVVADEQSRLLELRQHAIDGGEPDVETFRQQLLVDVLGGQMPHLGRLEHVDDFDPRQRRLETGALEIVGGVHVGVR